MRKLPLIAAASGLAAVATPVLAADISVTVEIPRISTSGYHRPYVSIWIQRTDNNAAAQTLAVWYDVDLPNAEGKDWLHHLRSWWRRGGRGMTMPADGISGATRAPGRHTITIPAARLRNLPAGQYNLVVEASRELGGREVVRVPFRWGGANTADASGSTELGAVRVTVSR
jgi:hypothetical protein